MKTITISWKDGGVTKFNAVQKTEVLSAYKPILPYIEAIVSTDLETGEIEILYEAEQEEINAEFS